MTLVEKIQEQIEELEYSIQFDGGPHWVVEQYYQDMEELKEQLEVLEDMDMGL